MNEEHLKACSSAEWAETVQKWIIPWVLEGIDLGPDVLEVGPGPGLTTDVLQTLVPTLTAVEIHPELASALAARLAGTGVDVRCADAAATGLASDRFSGAVCLTMLHHVDSVQRQDAVLAEVCRVLRPGGVLAGEDSLDSPELRALHHDDTYTPIDPDGFGARLAAAGFAAVDVSTNEYAVRFRGTKPPRGHGSSQQPARPEV
jgi:SAM-dependent methyltransferase